VGNVREKVVEWAAKKPKLVQVRVCGRDGTHAQTLSVHAVEGETSKPREGDGDIATDWATSVDSMIDAIVDALDEAQSDQGFSGWRLYGYDAQGKQIGSLAGRFERAADVGFKVPPLSLIHI
jgi:hypothetical protein